MLMFVLRHVPRRCQHTQPAGAALNSKHVLQEIPWSISESGIMAGDSFQAASGQSNSTGLFLGIDLSTQSITIAIIEASSGQLIMVDSLNFDGNLPQYGTRNGMYVALQGGVVTSPVAMWLEGLDILLRRPQHKPFLARVVAVSGSAQQHGSVYWNSDGLQLLRQMHIADSLARNLYDAFALKNTPIWADSSTQTDCDAIEHALGGPAAVAAISGSRCYARFTGPQIARIARTQPIAWRGVSRVSLISSFLSSLLIGRPAPIDTSDGSGMNLLNIHTEQWNDDLLEAAAPCLREKLGSLIQAWECLGPISPYFAVRYGLRTDCVVIPVSGDNSCSLVGMGLTPSSGGTATGSEEGDGTLMVSLGTSDTLVGLTVHPRPSTEGHIMISPRGPGEYYAMLVYKNGAIARESIRDEYAHGDWHEFSRLLKATPPGNSGRLGLYLKMEEITPLLNYTGTFRIDGEDKIVGSEGFEEPGQEVRALIEQRFMSMRVHAKEKGIAKPQRILATGGSSKNADIMQVLADVFEADVYVADISDSAAVGAALRAQHGYMCRGEGEWVEFPVTQPASLKRVASPSPSASDVYTPAVLARFAHFEREAHRRRQHEPELYMTAHSHSSSQPFAEVTQRTIA